MKKVKNIREKKEFWQPYSDMILESTLARSLKQISQEELAKRMGTTQSAISRFESMSDRLPSYEFIANLSFALNHEPGISLFGEYMATVSIEKHKIVDEIAKFENISTKDLVQNLLNSAIETKEKNYHAIPRIINASGLPDFYESVSKNYYVANSNAIEKENNKWPIAI